MDPNNKSQNKKRPKINLFESAREIGKGVADPFKDQLREIPRDFTRQIFGTRSFSGEIMPGEQIELKEVLSGEREQKQKLQKQLIHERRLREEEKRLLEEKTRELKLQLVAITQEIVKIARVTPQLDEEIKVAAFQVTSAPGIYHLFFFQRILEFIKSFRERIEDAASWLQVTNKRAQKKNYWSLYKKHGGKFLLSGEHYLTRSAG